MTVAARIRALRLAAGQSLDDVAAATRIHLPLLRCLEAGRPASADNIDRIARHFRVPFEEIAGPIPAMTDLLAVAVIEELKAEVG